MHLCIYKYTLGPRHANIDIHCNYSRKQKKVHVLSSYYDRCTERLTVKTLYKRRLNATLRLRSRFRKRNDENPFIRNGQRPIYRIHSPCCFPVANEACFWYLQLS